MPKFLVRGSFTASGLDGAVREGFASRQQHVTSLIEGMGGSVEAFYWAYGAADVFLIVDVPDATSVIAASLAVNRSGAVQFSTTPLLTATDMDAGVARMPDFRAPGA